MEYKSCVPQCQKTCRTIYSIASEDMCQNECVPGCQCKEGTFYDEIVDRCVPAENCSCSLRKRNYAPGDTIKIDCNKCSCKNGKWICEQNPCTKECAIIGYQHFQTFDGDIYDLRGDECEYTLVESTHEEGKKHPLVVKYAIEDCTDMMILCTSAVIVEYNNNTIKIIKKTVRFAYEARINNFFYFINFFHSDFEVIFNGKKISDLTKYPIFKSNLVVKKVTSLFTTITGFGFVIDFDTRGRVYVSLSPYYINKVQGLCGNMNGSPKDDRQSKINGPHSSLIEFSESFRQLSCKAVKRKKAGEVIDPCTTQSRVIAVGFKSRN